MPAIGESFNKLNPFHMGKNPVMFVTEVGAALTTLDLFFTQGLGECLRRCRSRIWLWFTVVFANFAEAMAEGRGKAQADTLRKSRTKTNANKLGPTARSRSSPRKRCARAISSSSRPTNSSPPTAKSSKAPPRSNESAITGESAPVIREAGGDRSAVTGGTTVLSDQIKVRVTANPGESFMDRMIGLIEGAKRQKTPNEIALSILLSALTIIFLSVVHHDDAVRHLYPYLSWRRPRVTTK